MAGTLYNVFRIRLIKMFLHLFGPFRRLDRLLYLVGVNMNIGLGVGLNV